MLYLMMQNYKVIRGYFYLCFMLIGCNHVLFNILWLALELEADWLHKLALNGQKLDWSLIFFMDQSITLALNSQLHWSLYFFSKII